MNLDHIKSRLEGIRSRGDGFTARCPAHEDKTPSLDVKDVGDRVLMICHAGCPTEDILSAIGLSWRDLFREDLDRPEITPTLRVSERRKLAVQYGVEFAIVELETAKLTKPSDEVRVKQARRRLQQLAIRYGVDEFDQIRQEWRTNDAYKSAPTITPTDEDLKCATQ